MALKGMAWGCKTPLEAQQLEWLEVDWFYTWNHSERYAADLAPGVRPEFVPHTWSDNPSRLAELPNLTAEQRRSGHLLGFNEPDHSGQANMTPAEAVTAWKHLEATGLRLVSPVTVSPNHPWMEEFRIAAGKAGLRIDVVAAHIYGSPHAGTFLNKLDELHERWDGRPVWVTETAVADFSPPNTYSKEQTAEYMLDIWAGVQARPWVERFAWKTRVAGDPVMPTSVFFHSDGTLTALGRLYASL